MSLEDYLRAVHSNFIEKQLFLREIYHAGFFNS